MISLWIDVDDTCHVPKVSQSCLLHLSSLQSPHPSHGHPCNGLFPQAQSQGRRKESHGCFGGQLSLGLETWKLIGSRSSFHVSSSFYIMFISGIGRDGIPSRFKKTSGSESKCRNRPFQRLPWQKCVLCQTLTKIECRPV